MSDPVSSSPPPLFVNGPVPEATGSGFLIRFWKILTSLRTAVVILGLSALLVFFGTLAQVNEGLYLAQERWFKSWFIWWQKAEAKGWKIPIFPGGYLLGTALLVNLLCSHFRRFKFPPGGIVVLLVHYAVVMGLIFVVTYFILWQPLWYSFAMVAILVLDMVLGAVGWTKLQASGRKIGVDMVHVGIVVMLVGQLITDMTAEETHLSFKEGETKRYSESHMACELAVTTDLAGDPAQDAVIAIPDSMLAAARTPVKHEKLPFSITVKQWMPNADLIDREEAIEAQATLAQAFATLEAKYSTAENLAVEAALVVDPQTPAATAADRIEIWQRVIHKIGARNPDKIESFKETVERLAGEPEKLKRLQEELKAEFRGRMLAGFKQRGGVMGYVAQRHEAKDPVTETSPEPQASSPVAQRYFVLPLPERRDMNSRNLPAAVIELAQDGKSLGTWLVTPHLKAQAIRSGEKEWRLGMRFARTYHPFAMTLLKTTHKVYPGTDTPRDFRSRVRLVRDGSSEDREVDIFMNSPMRLKDLRLTFFQHQMGRDEAQMNVGTSTLQVVHNPSWFSPYFACALVGYGMLRHFLLHLFRFISKRSAS